MNSVYLPEPCLCGATDCPRCFPGRDRNLDLADRMAELRVEHLWSLKGFDWFREFMECNASVDDSHLLHNALQIIYKRPDVDVKSLLRIEYLLREYMKAAEKFCADNDEPWIREVAESEMEDA